MQVEPEAKTISATFSSRACVRFDPGRSSRDASSWWRAITSPSTSATRAKGRSASTSSRERDGSVAVKEGDEIDVYFEASESEDGGIVLSRQKAEQLRVWKRHRAGVRSARRRRRHDRRQGEGRLEGRHRRRRVPPRLARRPPTGPQPRSLHRPAHALLDPQVQPLARQRRGLAARRDGARARCR